jgi:hypothetical protein
MSWFVTIEVENEEKANFLVNNTKETDSMLVVNTEGDEVELNILSIAAYQKVD